MMYAGFVPVAGVGPSPQLEDSRLPPGNAGTLCWSFVSRRRYVESTVKFNSGERPLVIVCPQLWSVLGAWGNNERLS